MKKIIMNSKDYDDKCSMLFALTNEMRQMEERLLELNVKATLNSIDILSLYDPSVMEQFNANVSVCDSCVKKMETRKSEE